MDAIVHLDMDQGITATFYCTIEKEAMKNKQDLA